MYGKPYLSPLCPWFEHHYECFWIVYMYVYWKSRKLLQKSQIENLTFSQMTLREISHLNRTASLSLRFPIMQNFNISDSFCSWAGWFALTGSVLLCFNTEKRMCSKLRFTNLNKMLKIRRNLDMLIFISLFSLYGLEKYWKDKSKPSNIHNMIMFIADCC